MIDTLDDDAALSPSRPMSALSGAYALTARAADVAARERDEAAELIRERGFALYCRGAGWPLVKCESVSGFEAAQRGARATVPYTDATNSTGATRARS